MLKSPNPGALANRPFRCPTCGRMTPFNQLMAPAYPAPYPPVNRRPVDPGKTQISGGQTMMRLIVEDSGKVIEIPSGNHTLGRDSLDSKATIKIASDTCMSREHARLTVTQSPQGVECVLTPMQSRNDIFVNNQRMSVSESRRLRNGDSILLGMTTLKVMI